MIDSDADDRNPAFAFDLHREAVARHAQLRQRLGRAAVPLVRAVAEVLQVLDAHLARPEAAGGEVAEGAEEGDAVAHLGSHGVPIELGPAPRSGARGEGISVYFRDPDGSLLEFLSYDKG